MWCGVPIRRPHRHIPCKSSNNRLRNAHNPNPVRITCSSSFVQFALPLCGLRSNLERNDKSLANYQWTFVMTGNLLDQCSVRRTHKLHKQHTHTHSTRESQVQCQRYRCRCRLLSRETRKPTSNRYYGLCQLEILCCYVFCEPCIGSRIAYTQTYCHHYAFTPSLAHTHKHTPHAHSDTHTRNARHECIKYQDININRYQRMPKFQRRTEIQSSDEEIIAMTCTHRVNFTRIPIDMNG